MDIKESTLSESGNEKLYKTKDYIRRAKANYYNRKKVNDEEFRGKEQERLTKWRDENRDKINERARIRRRELKKQNETMKDCSNVIVDAGTGIGVINTNLVDELVVNIEKKVNID
jgi:alpha-galactosidase/6-phospho-beta-glucosidase family protein